MVVREAGLLFRGFKLVSKIYYQTGVIQLDEDVRNALLTALIGFAKSAFSTKNLEYFEGNKFAIAFIEDKIQPMDSIELESLMAYAIFDKEKKLESYVAKVLQPLLKEVIFQFKQQYGMENLSNVSKFKNFEENLQKIFGMEAKKLEDRLHGVFY